VVSAEGASNGRSKLGKFWKNYSNGTGRNWHKLACLYIDDKTSIKDGDFPFFKQPEPRRTGHN
jgi:hypothetical protein